MRKQSIPKAPRSTYRPTRKSQLILELDLIGRKISLTQSDERLLLVAAESASGSSIGSRDLATRLKDAGDPTLKARRRLLFSRAESRALQRVIQAHHEPTEQLQKLILILSELLDTD